MMVNKYCWILFRFEKQSKKGLATGIHETLLMQSTSTLNLQSRIMTLSHSLHFTLLAALTSLARLLLSHLSLLASC